MPSRLTRREWTALLGVAPLAAQVTSPSTPPAGSPAPPKPPASPQERLAKAYAGVRDASNRLAKIEVPMDLEPAFSFHV
jgi:hypothetical protein